MEAYMTSCSCITCCAKVSICYRFRLMTNALAGLTASFGPLNPFPADRLNRWWIFEREKKHYTSCLVSHILHLIRALFDGPLNAALKFGMFSNSTFIQSLRATRLVPMYCHE